MNVGIYRLWPVHFSRQASLGRAGSTLVAVAIGLLVAASPAVLQAQAAGPASESWTLGLAGGAFTYEPAADNTFPMIAVRLDRLISRWARFEVGTTYTRPEIQTNGQGSFDPSLPAEHTNRFAVTLGLQAKYTLGRIEPYGGLSVGAVGRYFPGPVDGVHWRPTFQFPLGIRLWATDRIGARGEYRFKMDSHEGGVLRSDRELTGGVFWTL